MLITERNKSRKGTSVCQMFGRLGLKACGNVIWVNR